MYAQADSAVVFPNSPAASSLPAAEIERRQESFNSRRTLLRSNPSLYISKTRLSIRQLPLFVTDRGLKRLAIHAVRQFDAEVASGDREGLSRVEESDPTLSPALQARAESAGAGGSSAKGKGKASGKGKFFKHERETPVMQSKVVRQSEKLDPLTNLGKSKGYGFLEMRSHREALKVLRWANNNPEVGPLVWGWWREELQDLLKRAQEELAKRRTAQENGEVEKEDKEKEAKSGKVKESVEELESRVRKLEERTKEGDEHSGGGMRGGKTLLVEFSIENVQVRITPRYIM
jgi:nucleolar protein 4